MGVFVNVGHDRCVLLASLCSELFSHTVSAIFVFFADIEIEAFMFAPFVQGLVFSILRYFHWALGGFRALFLIFLYKEWFLEVFKERSFVWT
uniref:Uncharacterized protein n=1 Tax=Rhizophora mucronata TaxID=61149 RepID=A0A2P2L7C6_RHIMU